MTVAATSQILHGSATTTEAVRRIIKRSQESVRAFARPWDWSDDVAEVAQTGEYCRMQRWGRRLLIPRFSRLRRKLWLWHSATTRAGLAEALAIALPDGFLTRISLSSSELLTWLN